jgi:hypothetical protein
MNRALALAIVASVSLSAPWARAQAVSPPDEAPEALFAEATRALQDGRAGDAIAGYEALADRGVVDAVASYDRGLAYSMRIRIGAEQPGDLGRAVHGFEEALDLSQDARLDDDARRALVVVRSEVARRRVRAGQPVEVDPSRSLARALSRLLSEDVWSWSCLLAAVALGAGLFLRWLGRSSRARVAGGVTSGVALPVLAVAVAMTLAVRHDRGNLREAVVIGAAARPTDQRGIAVAGAVPLPEGARVEIIAAEGGTSRVRFGATDVWVASSALREIARRE